MSRHDERDASVERLLRETLATHDALEPTAACLDAEQAAAWIDGGLRPAERARLETHLGDCSRCQALVGAVARAAVDTGSSATGVSRRWLGWLLPVAAAAAVIIAVQFVPEENAPAPATLADASAAERPETDEARVAEPAAAPPPAAVGASEARGERRGEIVSAAARSNEQVIQQPPGRADDVAAAERLQRQVATAPAEAAKTEGLMTAAAAVSVMSPDPQVQWRVLNSAIERTVDGGATWQRVPAPVDGTVLAGASSGPGVCWLVGRSGFVMLTTDGTRWQRLGFPEVADLTSIEAADAGTATVTTSDGRIFHTSDGGATWVRRLLQEN